MSKEQYKGIHDVVNDQKFAMHHRAISNMRESTQQSKKDRLTSYVECFRSEDLSMTVF